MLAVAAFQMWQEGGWGTVNDPVPFISTAAEGEKEHALTMKLKASNSEYF